MGICPDCGSWVDEGDICGCCGGSGSYEAEDDEPQWQQNPRIVRADALSDEAWKLRNQGMYGDALVLINQAIDNYPYGSNYFNTKAIILQDMGRYEEALEFYDKALSFSRDRVILKNKASCMLDLADIRKYRGQITYGELNLINEALKILPDGESNYEYLQFKGNILEQLGEPVQAKICYFLSNKMFDEVDKADRQLKSMRNPDETYVLITGTNHYQNFKPFHEGAILDLIKEPDNRFDRDAIRAEINGETVGYIANSEWTLIKEVKSATDIRNSNSTKAEFAFILLDTYPIAKLI